MKPQIFLNVIFCCSRKSRRSQKSTTTCGPALTQDTVLETFPIQISKVSTNLAGVLPFPANLGEMMNKKTQGAHCCSSTRAQFLSWSALTISFTQLRIIGGMARSDWRLGVLSWLFKNVEGPRPLGWHHEAVSMPPTKRDSFSHAFCNTPLAVIEFPD